MYVLNNPLKTGYMYDLIWTWTIGQIDIFELIDLTEPGPEV